MKHWIALLAIALLSACAGQEVITGSAVNSAGQPIASSGIPITDPAIVTDLKDAASNLDQAVAIGALGVGDPAQACLHDVLKQAGIEVPAGTAPPKSFTAKNSGAVSGGTIAYIEAQQLKGALGQGITITPGCESLVGRIVIDGLKVVNKGIGAVLLRKVGL